MELTHQLAPMLRTLRLSGILETLDVRNRQAVEQQSSFVKFLTMLLHDEVERRAQSKLRLRLRRAAFDPTKTLEGLRLQLQSQAQQGPGLRSRHLSVHRAPQER